MIERERPSIFRIISVDYAATLAVFVPLFLLAMNAIDLYQGKTISDYTRNFLIAIIAISLLLLAWRVGRVYRLFSENTEERGTIYAASSWRGRRTITFTYDHRDSKYQARCQALSTGRTRAFKPGDQVDVLLDPGNPKNALIKQLYI